MPNPITYHHLTVTDCDGCVITLTPLPAERTPRWAEAISQAVKSDWRAPLRPETPYFAPPVPFVIPPPEGSGEPFFPHNHCPAITWCPNGDLLAAWFSTNREQGTEMTILASRLPADADAWQPAAEFFKAPNRNMTGTALFHDGKGTLYHFNGMGPEGAEGWENLVMLLRTSADNGASWTPPRVISPEAKYQRRNQVIAGTSVTPDGLWLQACDATPGGEGPSALHVSRDGGQTWSDPGGDIRGIHAGVVGLKDGRLLALGRAQALEGRMPMSLSADAGESWDCRPSPFPPISSGQRLVLMRLREGPLLLFSFTDPSHHVQRDAWQGMTFAGADGTPFTGYGMFAALSYDEGETWPVRRLVTPGGGAYDGGAWTRRFTATPTEAEPKGYLAATQTPDGVIHLISSRLHYRFNLAWLKAGVSHKPEKTDALGDSPDMWGTTNLASAETPERGAWFRESRFALFIHWGLYSQAAGCWNGKAYHCIAEWLMNSARIPVGEYEKLALDFNPVAFDARAVVRLAQEAGMKYIVITAKHHDGFAMFKSEASAYNIVDATPFGRDPIRELADACREGGLRLGFYYSQFQDWHEPDAAGNHWDFTVPLESRDFDKYLHEKAMPQIRELLTHYGPVGLIWFDTPGSISKEASQTLFDFVRHLQPDCLINSRIGNGLGDYATLGDQEVPLTAPDGLWETIDTHNDTWGFSLNDHNWKSARELISRLTRLVSLGGNYMLNVGPTGRGIIPEASAAILREVGSWLQRNGESIYGTQRSPIGLQAWGCSTRRGNKLYLHILHWPDNHELWVPGLGAVAGSARFLATGKAIRMSGKKGHLRLKLPAQPPDHPVTAIEVTLTGAPETIAPAAHLHPGLVNELGAPFATLTGCRCVKRSWMEKFGDWHHTEGIGEWVAGSEARWSFTALKSGPYDLYAYYECWAEADYSDIEICIAGQTWIFPAIYTGGGKGLRTRLRAVRIGRVEIPAGPVELTLRGLSVKGENALFVQKMNLTPADA